MWLSILYVVLVLLAIMSALLLMMKWDQTAVKGNRGQCLCAVLIKIVDLLIFWAFPT
jgi:hypothetical protein